MGLQFQPPPDWLIQQYMANRNPVVEGLNAAVPIAQLYMQQKQHKDMLALKQAEDARQEKELNIKTDQHNRKYNPAALTGAGGAYNKYAPQEFGTAETPTLTGDAQIRSLLTQSGSAPTLEPSMGMPQTPTTGPRSPVLDYWTSSNNQGVGMGQNTSLAPAPQNPQEQSNLDFANKFPQGLEGSDADSRIARSFRALDDKRTYQEKQEIYDDSGNPIGYWVLDTRTGKKEPRLYDDTEGGNPYSNGAQAGPKVKPQIPAASVEKTAGQKGFLDLISNIEKNYKPEFVGPVQSRLRKAGQKYDIPKVGLGASEQGANFERDLADLRSAVINERTGAAVGERQEWDRLLELIPDDAKSDKDFLPKLQSFKKRYAQIISNRESGFKKARYRNQGSSVPSGGGLTPSEQAELEALEAEVGG